MFIKEMTSDEREEYEAERRARRRELFNGKYIIDIDRKARKATKKPFTLLSAGNLSLICPKLFCSIKNNSYDEAKETLTTIKNLISSIEKDLYE
jgi:hypothetical protein